MPNNLIIPQKFKDLFVPNRSEEEQAKFTKQYKSEIRRRLLHGEELNAADVGIKEIINRGGRLSGKTKNGEIATLSDFFTVGGGDIWYCRSEDNTIRRSIFQSMQATIREFGFTVSNRGDTDFRATTQPFEIRCNLTGVTMQFFAINRDINRTKGMFPPSGKLSRAIVEEANEPDSPIYIDALRMTALRYMDEKSKIIYNYNPPPTMGAWANTYFPSLERKGATLIHSTWEDISALLDPSIIAQILRDKKEDPRHYAYWYGGEVVSLEGAVLYTFRDDRNKVSLEQFRRAVAYGSYSTLYIIYGVDSGVIKDATAVCAWAIMPDGTLVKLATMYLDPRKVGHPIPNTDQVAEMRRWYAEFYEKMRALGCVLPGAYNECWVFDSAVVTQDLMLEFQGATGYHCRAVENKNIERDIKRLQNGYFRGIFKVLDWEENAESLRETRNFCYGEDNEIPDGQDDHTIDADKYATAYYYYSYLSTFG